MQENPPQTDATPKAGARKMIGSGGHEDYAVIAKQGNFALGVKFVTKPAPNPQGGGAPILFGGFRVRAAADPDVKPFIHSAQEAADAFPNIGFEKIGDGGGRPRGSVEIGMGLPCSVKDLHLGVQAIKEARFVQKMMQWVVDHLTSEGVSAKDVLELNSDAFRDAVMGQIGKAFYPVTVGKLMTDGSPAFQEALAALVDEYADSLGGEVLTTPTTDSIEAAGEALQGLAEASQKNALASEIAGGPAGMFDQGIEDGIEVVPEPEIPVEEGEEIVTTTVED